MTQLKTLFFAIAIFSIYSAQAQLIFPSQSSFLKDTLAVKPLHSIVEDTQKSQVGKQFKSNVISSYYHNKFNGKRTASGKPFDNSKLTAAHRKLPFGTKVKVINPTTEQAVIVTITDRGPFTKGREIDLSQAAYKAIGGKLSSGVMRVNLEIIEE